MVEANASGTDKSSIAKMGLDSGIVGRAFRVISGIAGTYYSLQLILAAGIFSGFAAELAGYTAAWLIAYLLLMLLLGDRILARTNPWIGTVIFLSPVFIVLGADLGPTTFQVGLILYISISLIVTGLMHYGGCEVIAIPSLLFGKRYTVYCPFNVIDVVEKAVGGKKSV